MHRNGASYIALTGQKFISSIFVKKEKPIQLETNAHIKEKMEAIPYITVTEGDAEESDLEGESDGIEESLTHLFPRQNVNTEKEDSMAEARRKVEELLRQLREGHRPCDDSPETTIDHLLNALCHKDFKALRCAQAKLSIKAKDKKIDILFHS